VRWRDKIIFYPVHLTLFTTVFQNKYEWRFYSNSYDSYPGSGYWQQFEEMVSARQSSSIASGASNNTNASRAKSARPIMGRKSRVAVERREEHAAWRKICEELSFRMRSNEIT